MIGIEIVTFFLIVGAATYVGQKSNAYYQKKKKQWDRKKRMKDLEEQVIITGDHLDYAPLVLHNDGSSSTVKVQRIVCDQIPPMMNADGSTTISNYQLDDKGEKQLEKDKKKKKKQQEKQQQIPKWKVWKKKEQQQGGISYAKIEEDWFLSECIEEKSQEDLDQPVSLA
jgi:hypothetical protein